MIKLMECPVEMFRDQIMEHFRTRGPAMYQRIRHWMELSLLQPQVANDSSSSASVNNENGGAADIKDGAAGPEASNQEPDFPLIPASRGFCITLEGLLERFRNIIEAI